MIKRAAELIEWGSSSVLVTCSVYNLQDLNTLAKANLNMADEQLEFGALDITFGQQFLLHPDPTNKKMVFSCTLIGCLEGQSLIIGPDGAGVFPSLAEGQKIIVRIVLDSGIALFPTTVLFISDIPAVMIYLDFPPAVQFKRLRAAKRVVVAQPILVSNLDNSAYTGIAGKLIDISTGGGRVQMFDTLGGVGDRIELKGKFQVHGIARLLTVKACIRKRDGKEYGVQFVEQDEDKLIVLMGFIFNAMLTGNLDAIH
ncbi:MAG TPA: flagellar brake protein [Marinagarivorans sp.]